MQIVLFDLILNEKSMRLKQGCGNISYLLLLPFIFLNFVLICKSWSLLLRKHALPCVWCRPLSDISGGCINTFGFNLNEYFVYYQTAKRISAHWLVTWLPATKKHRATQLWGLRSSLPLFSNKRFARSPPPGFTSEIKRRMCYFSQRCPVFTLWSDEGCSCTEPRNTQAALRNRLIATVLFPLCEITQCSLSSLASIITPASALEGKIYTYTHH